jgi:predicted tellurium resistance membrane protein TerC
MLALITDLNAWAALLTLTALEIVLGIDNVVFVSLLAANLDAASGRTARQIGFALAFIFRVAMLFALTSLGQLRYPVLVVFGDEFSWRDVILIGFSRSTVRSMLATVTNDTWAAMLTVLSRSSYKSH